jgi:predicted dehydrogenase
MTQPAPAAAAQTENAPSVAVIGCGYWGKNLVRNFKELGNLALVADVTEAGRQTAAGLAPGVPVVGEVQDALTSGVAGVVISTPAVTHFELVRQALLAGKDVFVEKPLALRPEEGAELVGLADANGCILMVGHVLEYHPAVVRLHELVRSGELGRVQYIYSNRLSLGKVRRE